MRQFWSLHWSRFHLGLWWRSPLWFEMQCIRDQCNVYRRSFTSCPKSLNPHRKEFFGSRYVGVCWEVWLVLRFWHFEFWRCLRVGWWLVGLRWVYFRWRWFWCVWLLGLRVLPSWCLYQPWCKWVIFMDNQFIKILNIAASQEIHCYCCNGLLIIILQSNIKDLWNKLKPCKVKISADALPTSCYSAHPCSINSNRRGFCWLGREV